MLQTIEGQSGGGQAGFDALVRDLRPKLFRFCARMAGSVAEGEDIVQEALLKAMQAFPGLGALDHPEAWLFRIARNAALDALRRRQRSRAILVPQDEETIADPVDAADQREIAALGLGTFMTLSPVERGSVILMDVLGYSLGEIVQVMDTTLPAVKAALHRGRRRLRALASRPDAPPSRALDPAERARLAHYVDRFNARDFDAVRDLLAADVRLDLAGFAVLEGKQAVSRYFGNYAGLADWRLGLGLVDGAPALLLHRAGVLANLVLLTWTGDRITGIRDFFHCPDAVALAEIEGLPED